MSGTRRANDFYPTPHSIIEALFRHWIPSARMWEPCAGDGRFAHALRRAGVHEVIAGDIRTGQDFFAVQEAPCTTLVTNPPFKLIRPFIDHAFAIGVTRMALICPERLWACAKGGDQFARHRPSVWANLTWREDYLSKGGSPDRALAVAVWDTPHATRCEYQIWNKEGNL
jgi:hypothetical protein